MLIPYLRSRVLFPVAERLSGRDVNRRVELLLREFDVPWDERKRRNRVRLVEVLQNAMHEIPFYGELFRKVGFDPLKVLKDIRYFEQLPILTKEDIREAGDRLLSPRARQFLTVSVHRTNGSTGSALPIYYTPAAKDLSAAVTRISQRWVGFGPGDLQMHISSAFPGETPAIAKRQEWWRRQATNRLSVEVEAWTEQGLDSLWASVRDAGAYLIQGHPSTMYALARHVERRQGRSHGVFKVFVSTGEALAEQQRNAIERVFGCRAANRYGNAEFGIMAHDRFVEGSGGTDAVQHDGPLTPMGAAACRYMQVMDPYVWVESVGLNSNQRGALVVTDLTNFSSPLIRYATGDEGNVVCGTEGLYLEDVAGRVHDKIVIDAKSYPTHWFQDLFTRLGNVDDFQFVRAADQALQLRLCLLDDAGAAAMRSRLEELFPRQAFDLRFVRRSDFVRVGQQQKFRYLVELTGEAEAPPVTPTELVPQFVGEAKSSPLLYLTGWNALETYGEVSFRWMARRGTIAINPKWPAKRVLVEFDYPATADALPDLRAFERGQLLSCLQVHGGPQVMELELDEVTEGAPRILEFEVSHVYRVPNDARELGLKVHALRLQA
ncbi:phenylacetate--CoA ligase family protein [Thiomonas sp. FB-6]|uniref:phenylacetate--CoA ligase family protein n=1 Tax=Thiomonas sp. FB-6 TaxID=1158291 RepID=UPI00036B6AAF|nr:phenylacetate--CoA ligase family protein [Thiomonas sp. FB-6]